jgi:hypothetical protein
MTTGRINQVATIHAPSTLCDAHTLTPLRGRGGEHRHTVHDTERSLWKAGVDTPPTVPHAAVGEDNHMQELSARPRCNIPPGPTIVTEEPRGNWRTKVPTTSRRQDHNVSFTHERRTPRQDSHTKVLRPQRNDCQVTPFCLYSGRIVPLFAALLSCTTLSRGTWTPQVAFPTRAGQQRQESGSLASTKQ